ncbi:MAG: dihydrofolate reductase family protein [Gemmatimonadetes bacterium]|nr:dihydrofolate reductase family protein [Gemmatimonadota bacterium]
MFVGTSLDGFIARPDGALDFLPDEPEPHGFEEFLASVDALVWGRRTYDFVRGFDTWHYGEKPVFVLSSRDIDDPPAGAIVERMSGDPIEIAAALEARGIGHIYVDGGRTIRQFLRAGLIQRIVITRVPVLIGSGIPIFGPVDDDIPLTHVDTRQFPSGLVQSEYEVASTPDRGSRSLP